MVVCGTCAVPQGWVSDEDCAPRHLQGTCNAGFCSGSADGYLFSCQKYGCTSGAACYCDGCKCKKHSLSDPNQKHFKDCGSLTTSTSKTTTTKPTTAKTTTTAKSTTAKTTTTTKSTTAKTTTTENPTTQPTAPVCNECCTIDGDDPSSCGPKDTKKFAKCEDGTCKFSNGTYDVSCHSTTCDVDRKRWRSNGAACDCDCACSADVSNTKKKWRDCAAPSRGNSCSSKKSNNLLDAGAGADADSFLGEPEQQAPQLVPAEVPLSTPDARHHHKRKHASKDDSSSDGEDDDDDDHESHKTCRNGRHEHGEECDGPSDDTLFMICSERCKLEVFWPPIVALILLAAVILCCCCFLLTRCVRLRAGRQAKAYRKAMACDAHGTINCEICKAAQPKTPLQVTVVKNQFSPSASSSSASDVKKPKKG